MLWVLNKVKNYCALKFGPRSDPTKVDFEKKSADEKTACKITQYAKNYCVLKKKHVR